MNNPCGYDSTGRLRLRKKFVYMFRMISSPNSEHFNRVDPRMRRSKSYVTRFAPILFHTGIDQLGSFDPAEVLQHHGTREDHGARFTLSWLA